MGIDFYCGVNEKTWNHHPVTPGPLACIAPVYGNTKKRVNSVVIPKYVRVLQDSGAFSDGPRDRLSFEEALQRQIKHAEKYGYKSQLEAVASYDVLIDETWKEDFRSRHKERWSEEAGKFAVKTTIEAARFLSLNRLGGVASLQSIQGVTPQQYMECARGVVNYVEDGDIVGLGGWCIIGKMPKRMLPVFKETVVQVIPFLGSQGVKRVHIWGVCYAPALAELLYVCDRWGIRVSTDSAHPSMSPAFGNWGYGDWRIKQGEYKRPSVLDSCREHRFYACVGCRGLERARHVRCTREWLENFRITPYYKEKAA